MYRPEKHACELRAEPKCRSVARSLSLDVPGKPSYGISSSEVVRFLLILPNDKEPTLHAALFHSCDFFGQAQAGGETR